MSKLTVVHPYEGLLLRNNEGKMMEAHSTVDEYQVHYVK